MHGAGRGVKEDSKAEKHLHPCVARDTEDADSESESESGATINQGMETGGKEDRRM